ncbi:lipocalin family protein, partial [Algibacter sp.]|uniref:lipocalin family protein n=1 Tax=Algibacter sp. TaxID=1872428 RepID=UPI003C78CB6C
MSRIVNVFFILTIGLLVSCSSDDSNDSNSFKTDIIGTWEGFSATINGEETIENGDCLDRVIFTSNTVESKEYYDYEDGAGCVLDYESGAGTYSINGNMLTGTVDGETITFEILVLNGTTLKIKGSVTEDGVTFTFIETFRRL